MGFEVAVNVSHHLARPLGKLSVFDLVEETGFDMSEWLATAKPGKRKANPRLAFEWAFVAEQRFVILSIWYREIRMTGRHLTFSGNFRARAELEILGSRVNKVAARALRADSAVQQAFRSSLPLRIIVNDGEQGQVTARDLDPASWSVTFYCTDSGDFCVTREEQLSKPTLRLKTPLMHQVSANPVRSDYIRSLALQRAKGRCEYCGMPGFRTRNGLSYLETHHVEPLSEGGTDDENNVIALCANHHREAHFGFARLALKSKFKKAIAIQLSDRVDKAVRMVQSAKQKQVQSIHFGLSR